jgi:putative endonuclease
MFNVYVLKSIGTGKIYIGHTNELQKRLLEHQSGFSAATKHARDWELIHFEEYPDRALAMKRETYLKSGDGRKVLKLKGIF